MSANQNQNASAAWKAILSPTRLDLALLILGVILGILAGPLVLGKINPAFYQKHFQGTTQAQQQLDDYLAERAKMRKNKLEISQEGDSVLTVHDDQTQQRAEELRAEIKQASAEFLPTYTGRMKAILLALVGIMLIETLVNASTRRFVAALDYGRKLGTARYALIALWLAMLIANPATLKHTSLTFAAAVLAVALIAAMAPLGKTETTNESQ